MQKIIKTLCLFCLPFIFLSHAWATNTAHLQTRAENIFEELATLKFSIKKKDFIREKIRQLISDIQQLNLILSLFDSIDAHKLLSKDEITFTTSEKFTSFCLIYYPLVDGPLIDPLEIKEKNKIFINMTHDFDSVVDFFNFFEELMRATKIDIEDELDNIDLDVQQYRKPSFIKNLKNKFSPNILSLHSGNYLGHIALGAGWASPNKHHLLNLLVGKVFNTRTTKKLNQYTLQYQYAPYIIPLQGLKIRPYLGASIIYSQHKDLFFLAPDPYPVHNYYRPTNLHTTVDFGLGFIIGANTEVTVGGSILDISAAYYLQDPSFFKEQTPATFGLSYMTVLGIGIKRYLK